MASAVISEEEQMTLRNQFLTQVKQFYPTGHQKKKFFKRHLIKKHASVLGLKAFVLSQPYDIPHWMAEVLTTMILASHDKDPIRSTVTETLGSVRSTHEAESHEELRNAFDDDTWEAIQAVGSQASYFT